MKKPKILTLVGAGITGIALTGGVLSMVSADPAANQDSVLAKVIAKLGLNVTTTQLQDALKSSEKEVRTEQLSTDLASAVTAGKLTQEQADLAKKVQEWMQNNQPVQPAKPSQAELDKLTVAEARAKMDAERTARDAEVAARKTQMLTDLGITEGQLTSLQTALKSANIRGGMMMDGGKGMGGMRGPRGGSMQMGEMMK